MALQASAENKAHVIRVSLTKCTEYLLDDAIMLSGLVETWGEMLLNFIGFLLNFLARLVLG